MRRIFYDAWDVTALAVAAASSSGIIALGARVGPGFFAHAAAFRATNLPFRAELYVEYASGAPTVVGADSLWAVAPDAITFADLYHGEVVDARQEAAFAGWDMPGYAPSPALWVPAVLGAPKSIADAVLTSQDFPRIGAVATLAPSTLTQPLPGLWVFAFPQMFAGKVELRVPSPASAAGIEVTLYAGELLWPNGTVDNELISATNESVAWTLAGTGSTEVVSTTFMYWGLQFVQVTGWPAGVPAPTLGDLRGIALSSARERTGELAFAGIEPSAAIAASAVAAGVTPTIATASAAVAAARAAAAHPEALELVAAAAERAAGVAAPLDAATLAGVQHALVWGGQSNWFSVPSDCPTREKRGWMG